MVADFLPGVPVGIGTYAWLVKSEVSVPADMEYQPVFPVVGYRKRGAGCNSHGWRSVDRCHQWGSQHGIRPDHVLAHQTETEEGKEIPRREIESSAGGHQEEHAEASATREFAAVTGLKKRNMFVRLGNWYVNDPDKLSKYLFWLSIVSTVAALVLYFGWHEPFIQPWWMFIALACNLNCLLMLKRIRILKQQNSYLNWQNKRVFSKMMDLFRDLGDFSGH